MHKLGIGLREVVAALLLVGLSACAGNGCSCVAPIKGGFPVTKRHENAIQIRASAGLFDFVGKNGSTLLTGLLGGSTFNVPPQCGGSTPVCCAMPNQVCSLSLDVKDLSLTPAAPNTLALNTDVDIKTVQPLPVTILGSHCLVAIDTTTSQPANIKSTLTFAVDKTSNTTGLSASNSSVNIQASSINLSGDILCIGAQIPGIHDIVVGILNSVVAGQISTIVGQQACAKCMAKDDCNSFATACTNGECMEADGTTCVPSLGIEGKIDLGSLLASFSPSTHATVDLLAVTGGYAAADTGLSLGMLGGAQGDPHSDCVPVIAPPTVPAVAQSKTFFADTLPDGKTPFHLGVGIHHTELDTIGWGAFDSGMLCLHVGTPQVALLSTKTIGVVIPSVADLTHTSNAPMYIALKPSRPPTFTLGKGTFKTDGSGNTVVDDPLLKVALPGLSIDFYTWVDDRYVRIMTLTADLVLPLGLQVGAGGGINPIFGDLTSAFQNVQVTNAELLAEAPSQLADAFPMLLSVAVGQIAANLKNIQLPALLGLQLQPVAFTSTDPDANSVNQFLALYLNLATPTKPFAAVRAAETRAQLVRVSLPPTREFAVTGRAGNRPLATVRVDGDGAGTLEYSWSLDDGLWSAFSPGPELTIDDPRLWLQGKHQVAVRARVQGAPDSIDPSPAELPLIVDTIAPTGGFDVAGGELVVDASDNVSDAGALRFRVALGGGAFGDWIAGGRIAVPANAADVRVEAVDEAGNVGELGFHGRTTAGGAKGCGCAVGGKDDRAPLSAILVALAAVALFARGRRRLLATVATAVVALATLGAAGGCNSSHPTAPVGKGDLEDPADEIGRFLDAAVHGNTLYLSGYDDTYGDLAFATVTDAKAAISWEVVDGLDLTAPPSTKDGYRHGITDQGDDVGQYTSLALTRGGDPYIAYYDATNKALKIAIGPHPFKVHTVDIGASGSDVGRFAALSLDSHDTPSIAYVATNIPSGTGFKSELRVATAHGNHPSSASDWTITVADSTPISCAGLCTGKTACIMPAMVNGMANNDPSTSTCLPIDAAACTATCTADTQVCINNVCTNVLAPPGAGDLPEGIGLFVNARRTSKDALVLAYYDHEQGDVKLASNDGGAWKSSFLDGQSATTDVGQNLTLRLGSDDSVHVAYQDAIGDQLLYKHVMGGAVPMAADVVDDGTRSDGHHSVGAGANLILDGSGNPRIVYQDQQLSDLELATHGGSWSHADLATGTPGYGFYPRQVLLGGKVWLAEFVYDRANNTPLGKVQITVP